MKYIFREENVAEVSLGRNSMDRIRNVNHRITGIKFYGGNSVPDAAQHRQYNSRQTCKTEAQMRILTNIKTGRGTCFIK